MYGLRGVGKTVLLNEFQAMAEQRGWITLKIEATNAQSVLPLMAQSLYRSLRIATGRFDLSKLMSVLGVFQAFTLRVDPSGTYSFGFDLAAATGRADSGDPSVDLEELFRELGLTAASLGIGCLLLIDEMQDVAEPELRALNTAMHHIGQGFESTPITLVGAGLPSLPEILSKATSYAERLYEYVPVGALDQNASYDALVAPAEALDVDWTLQALERIHQFSRGYPYFIQTGGKYVWDYAAESPIGPEDAEAGLQRARSEVDSGLYRARWQRATPLQRSLMRAMADLADEGSVPMSDVADRLARQRNELSVPRDQLIKKGLVYAPDRGHLAFTVPGMADYARRQPE